MSEARDERLNKRKRGRPEKKGRRASGSKTEAKGSVPSDVKSLGTDRQAKTMKALFLQGKREATFLFLLPKHLHNELFAGRAQVLILHSL